MSTHSDECSNITSKQNHLLFPPPACQQATALCFPCLVPLSAIVPPPSPFLWWSSRAVETPLACLTEVIPCDSSARVVMLWALFEPNTSAPEQPEPPVPALDSTTGATGPDPVRSGTGPQRQRAHYVIISVPGAARPGGGPDFKCKQRKMS